MISRKGRESVIFQHCGDFEPGKVIGMCLAVPMKIESLTETGLATAELEGIRYDVNCALIEDARVGDYVIVHAGFAIEKLDETEANARLRLFEELCSIEPDITRTGDTVAQKENEEIP